LKGEAAAKAAEPPRGRPVSVLPPAGRAPGRLDFRASRHASFLGDGWFDWRVATAGQAGGWRVADRALLVLPDRSGSFRVAGRVPAGSARPIDLRLERVGGVSKTIRLDTPGSFELRLNLGEGLRGASADGYAVFVLDPDPLGGPVASPLRVERIGFESSPLPGEARGAGE
jgi:hypothetical protein